MKEGIVKNSWAIKAGSASFVLFIIFTVLAKKCDLGPIGFGGAMVGFSHINGAFNRAFPYCGICFKVTEVLGYLCLLIAAIYAVLALVSLIKTKSLAKMDRDLLVTMFLYAVVVFFYVLFNKVVINVRPTELEASYPSSHTMLAVCVLYSAYFLLGKTEKINQATVRILKVLCLFGIGAMVVLRLISGVHWLTDIVGALILSASLLLFYRGFLDGTDKKTV